MTASADPRRGEDAAREAAGLAVLGRSEGPPLRFRGAPLAGHVRQVGNARIEIALWTRAAGGFAVAATLEDAAAPAAERRRSHAALVPDLAAAAGALESWRPLGSPESPGVRQPRRSAPAAAERLLARARRAALAAAYAEALGEALAGWPRPESVRVPFTLR